MGSLVTAAEAAYQTWKSTAPQSIEGWDDMTDAQIASRLRDEQKCKQAIVDAQEIEQSFYDARTSVFAELEAEYASKRVALSQLWQAKEDAGFDVDYVPEAV